MSLDLTQSLRLEVEIPATGLANLVPNPSGDLGAWGWVTPVANTFIDVQSNTDGPYLRFKTTVSQAAYWTSTFMPVLAGQWVAARFDTVFATTSHNVKVRYEWYDSAKTLLSSSVQSSGYDATVRTNYVAAVQAPANTAYAKVRFDFYNGTVNPVANTFYGMRKVMVTTNATNTFSTTRTNLVPNPSFEVNTTGWTAVPGTPTAIARSTTVGGYKGTAALRLTASAAGDLSATTGYLAVSPGQDYAYQARFRAGTTGRSAVTIIEWYDSAKNFITSIGKNVTDAAGAWALSSNSMTAPTNAAFACVVTYVWSAAAGEVHYVDAVMLEKSTTVGTYFDGSFASAGTLTYAWKGTAHNSASTETNTSFAYAQPSTWQNILGPSHEIRIEREALNVGTLTATVLDALLDPAVADTIRPGKQLRLTALNDSGLWEPMFTGTVSAAEVTYDLKNPNTDRQVNIALTATDNIATLANTAETGVVATIGDLAYVLEDAGVPWNLNGSGNQVANPTIVATNDNASVVDQVSITRDIETGYAWVDRFNVLQAFSPSALSGAGLITNPSFDSNAAGWNASAGTITRDTGVTHSAPGSGKFVAATSGRPFLQPSTYQFTVQPGASFVLSAWHNIPAALSQPYYMVVEFYDNFTNYTYLGDAGYAQPMQAATSGWAFHQVAFTVPANATGIIIYPVISSGTSAAADTIYLDDAQLRATPRVALTEADYSDLNASFDTDHCINEVNVTWLRYNIGTEETTEVPYGPYRDLASIAEWGARSATFTIAGATEDPTTIANYANAVLAANGTPQVRINSVTLPIKTQADLTSVKPFLDLYDLVEVSNAAKALDHYSRITSISHQITPTGWLMTLGFETGDSVASPQMTPSPPVPSGVNPNSGEIRLYAGASAPDGWLLCNGGSYATSAYPSLFAAIGYTFGGSGSTFKVPNLTDRFPIGAGTKALGAIGGANTVTIKPENMAPHTHNMDHGHSGRGREGGPGPQTNTAALAGGTATLHTDATFVNNTSGQNTQDASSQLTQTPLTVTNPWLAINFIIRA